MITWEAVMETLCAKNDDSLIITMLMAMMMVMMMVMTMTMM